MLRIKKSLEYSVSIIRNYSRVTFKNGCRASSTFNQVTNPFPATYKDVYERSLKNPEEFWAEAAEQIVWSKKWDRVLDNSNEPFTKWFVGGELNTVYNAVDRHVENGFGDSIAIIHDSPVTNTIRKITYRELQEEVSKFAFVLRKHGVEKGDRVLIYMPMVPEAVIAMLAIARLGAIHSLVFGGFASKELSTRISHAQPKAVVSCNCGVEPNRIVDYKPLLDKAIEYSSFKPKTCIIFNRKEADFQEAPLIKGRDVCYQEEMSGARGVDCVPVSATDPLYILYTSGTTGLPKAVVRPSGGHAVVLNWSMKNIYGLNPDDVWFAASDLGWVVGHSYIVYAPLLHRNTTILYEGKPVNTPNPGAYFRMFAEHNITSMFVAPTALRAVRREDPDGEYVKQYKFPNFKYLFVAGEHCDHETMEWIRNIIKVPILDNWWQTETGSAITATNVGLGNDLYPPPGVAGKPVPGWNLRVIRKDNTECSNYELGQIVAKLPLPPTCLSTLWESDDRFEELYFRKYPGYYDTMDSGYRDEHGNIAVMARSDDVINVAGHRLSTGQLEEAILEDDELAECAVVGTPDPVKGQVPLGLVVLKHGQTDNPEKIKDRVIKAVRDHVGPVAAFKTVVIVPGLPKTRSGKIARNTIAAMVSGKPFKIPVTIENPNVYLDMEKAFKEAGFNPTPPPL